jgi:predicted PurR-regulated permease PerM
VQTNVNKLAHRIWVGVVVTITILALAYIVMRIPRTIEIFVLASLIALGNYPVTSRLERYMPRAAAITLVFSAMAAVLVVTALLIVPATFGQMQALLVNAPDYTAWLVKTLERFEDTIRVRFGAQLIGNALATMQSEIPAKAEALLTLTVGSLGAILVGTANVFFVGISAVILSFFLLAQGKSVAEGVLGLLPHSRQEHGARLLHEIVHIFGSFVAGQVILCSIVGVACWLFLLPLHFQFALLVGILCGIGYAVPYLGMFAAQAIAAVLAIPQGGGMVLWVTVIIFIIARVADSILGPKVMSDAVGVSPIGIMFASFAGGEAFGLPGLLLGIPAAALVKVLFEYFVTPYIVRLQLSDAEHEAAMVPATLEIEDVPLDDEAVATSIPVR